MQDSKNHKEAEASSTGCQACSIRGQFALIWTPFARIPRWVSSTFRIGNLSSFNMSLVI